MDAATRNNLVVIALAILASLFFLVRHLIRQSKKGRIQHEANSGLDYLGVTPSVQEVFTYRAPPMRETFEAASRAKSEEEVLAEARDELSACETPGACWDVFNSVMEGSKIEEEASSKAVHLSRIELAAADDIDRCWEIIDLFRDKEYGESDAVVDEAISRIFIITTSFEDAISLVQELRNRWDDGVEEEVDKALRLAISLACDYDEADTIFDECDEDSEIELEAFRRMLTFTEDVETCQSLWDACGVDTDLGELAIVRAAEIIKAKESDSK